MPNQQVIKQWVDALRSGEYKQATGRLGRHDSWTDHYGETYQPGHCCLGVLCELAAKAGVITRVEDPAFQGLIKYDSEVNVLPSRVAYWAGLDSCNPTVDYPIVWADEAGTVDQGTDTLSTLNDEQDMSFDQIADAIEMKFLAKSDAGQPA